MLEAARALRLPDVIGPGLEILFCGINPGLYSAATGHHFARPGNRFWPALHRSGLTPRQFRPEEEQDLLALRLGITDLAGRATASADELALDELVAGGKALLVKLRRYRPRYLAVLGIGAYRTAFRQPKALLGLQPDLIAGVKVWVLPSPSGLNAHYSLADLASALRALAVQSTEQ